VTDLRRIATHYHRCVVVAIAVVIIVVVVVVAVVRRLRLDARVAC
jgi:hypothetical protein